MADLPTWHGAAVGGYASNENPLQPARGAKPCYARAWGECVTYFAKANGTPEA